MKIWTMFLTFVLLMGVMLYLSPNPVKSQGPDVDIQAPGVRIFSAPVSIGPAEAVQVLLLLVPDTGTSTPDTVAPPRDSACNAVVTYIDSDGDEVGLFETELQPHRPTTSDFNPVRTTGGRYTFAAEVRAVGSNSGPCHVSASVLIYDAETGETRGAIQGGTTEQFILISEQHPTG